MPKFSGKVGYVIPTETAPGVYENIPNERQYYGNILRNTSRITSSGYLNDNVSITNDISIVADPFAYQNYQWIRYVTYFGQKWKITRVDITRYPRIVLSMGDVYNGE